MTKKGIAVPAIKATFPRGEYDELGYHYAAAGNIRNLWRSGNAIAKSVGEQEYSKDETP
jgi:hypothetical protein